MSWWDTSSLTNFASQASKALKNAQKKIDKVLDIDEEGARGGQTSQQGSVETSSWSTDGWGSWSMSSWDAGGSSKTETATSDVSTEEKSSTKSTSLLQEKLATKTSPRQEKSTTKLSSASGKQLQINKKSSEPGKKLILKREKSSESLEKSAINEETGLSQKSVQPEEKVTELTSTVSQNVESSVESAIDNKLLMSDNIKCEDNTEKSANSSVQDKKTFSTEKSKPETQDIKPLPTEISISEIGSVQDDNSLSPEKSKSEIESIQNVKPLPTEKSKSENESIQDVKPLPTEKSKSENESIQDSNPLPTEKSKSETDSLDSSSVVLTGSNAGSSDRLSPLSVGSGEVTSSYEKVSNDEKQTNTSIHSIFSGSELSDSINHGSDNVKVSGDILNIETLPSDEKSFADIDKESSLCELLSTGSVILGDTTLDGSVHSDTDIPSEIKQPDDANEASHSKQEVSIEEPSPTVQTESEKSDSSNRLSDFVESHFENTTIENTQTEIDNASENTNQDNTENTKTEAVTSFTEESLEQCESSKYSSSLVTEKQNEDEKESNDNSEVPITDSVSMETSEGQTVSLSPIHHMRSGSSESHDDQPSSPLTTSSSGDGSKLDSSMDTDDTVVDRKADSDSMDSVSPSSSYVKCMIEEAMDDSVKIEDNSSDGHSIGKSECSRSTGGHESGDEVDTTTSSDIEIISTPTSNGDSNKFIDLSPLKIALQKTARRNDGTHRRNDSHDSQSSSSSHSRDGHGEQMSPGRDTDSSEDGVEMKITSEEAKQPLCRELPPLDEEVADPYNTQKLLKKLAEMAEVLQAREDKLIVLSKENMDLMETSNILRNQMQQLEETRSIEMEDIEQVTNEFTERLSESEKLCQQAIREKEAIKRQSEEMQTEFQKKMMKLDAALKEKEQTVAELLQEGEKLSKQQLQSNTIIKKLRSKEKETDSLTTGYRKKIDEQTSELEHLKNVLDSKEEMEKKQTEAINQLNAAVQKQERELSKLKSIESDSSERVRGLQTALDNSYKEIAELNKSKIALDSQAQAAALSQEMYIREELKATLEREQLSFRQEREALINQIEDLRLSMQRMEKEHNRREDMLRQEISDLQVQLQEDEARNQDLSHSVTTATRPLLRQIENLQSTFSAQSSSWEKVEKNLSDRLSEAQTQLATVTERERSASEKLMEISTQITSLESQNSHLRQDKSQLSAQLEMLRAKITALEDAKHSETAQLEAFKQQSSQDTAELRKEKVFLETQLDMEKTKLEQEKKKFMLAQEQITQLERDLQRPQSRESHSPVSVSRQESISSFSEPPNLMLSSFSQEDIDKHWMIGTPKTSLYDSLRQSGAANLLENLQSQLKLREGEIVQLQSDIQQLERTRESMARELVNLTNQNESLEEKIQELPQVQEQLKDVNQRYNALLQMYGEKVEEAEELRLDLNDVKEMYKMQIDHLLAK